MNEIDPGLNRYLREIGRIPLLTPQDEIELARKIKKGDASARERMINANLRLVGTIARDYTNLGLPLLDLISEGNIGLTKAVERFDPAKGAKLSTYAMWFRRGCRQIGQDSRDHFAAIGTGSTFRPSRPASPGFGIIKSPSRRPVITSSRSP